MSIHIEAYYSSLNKINEELCGDKIKITYCEDFFLMVLADGLGSGVKANILATLTSEILTTMIKEGASIDEAVDTITSTLPVCKERGIAYSTFIVLQVYNDGRAYLVEYDNPQTLLLRDNKVVELNRKKIVKSNKVISEAYFNVKTNDFIVMYSDGIEFAGNHNILNLDWDCNEISNFLVSNIRRNDNAIKLCNKLINVVKSLYQDNIKDDSTVAIAHVLPQRYLSLMIGAPKNKADDKKVVRNFLRLAGKKIVCGGTTSKIVARELSKDIVDIKNDGFAPTLSSIEGIDLVCEGVLTLNNVLMYLKKCNESKDYYDQFISENNSQAAYLVCSMLLKATNIKIIIGMAKNFAHIDIGIENKFNIIEDIVKQLTIIGKKVTLEKY